jgi:hypothetical protein
MQALLFFRTAGITFFLELQALQIGFEQTSIWSIFYLLQLRGTLANFYKWNDMMISFHFAKVRHEMKNHEIPNEFRNQFRGS